MSDNKYLKKQEIVDYPGKKLPVVFLIDISSSMNACEGGVPTGRTEFSDGVQWNIVEGGHSIMQDLLERVQDFHDAMKDDRKASITCQTAYVTFGDDARMIEDFGIVKNKKAPIDKLEAGDNETYIVKGIKKALQLLDEQKKLIRDEGGDYYQPWLIIFTDGQAHDASYEIQSIKNELKSRQHSQKLTVYTMALNDDPNLYQQLRGYSIYKPIPFDKNKNELNKFFSFLKKSISSISNNKIKGDVSGFTEMDDTSSLQ